jgi:hypothetical protein
MTLRDLAHVALRIAAVVIVVDILVSLPMAFAAARYYAPAVIRLEIVETVLPPYAISLVGAFLIYVFAGKIADWTALGGKPEVLVTAADVGALERIAVAVLGLYLLIMGLADVVNALVHFVALKLTVANLPYNAGSFAYAPDKAAGLADAIFRVVLGGLLVRNSDAFMRLKDKLRGKRGVAGETRPESETR